MPPFEPSGTHASAYQFVPSHLRPSPWLRLAVAIGAAMLAIGVVLLAGAASAADWQMIKCKPGQPCEVAHIYWDNAGAACETDAVGEKIVRPGVRVKCERVVPSKEAAR